MNQERSRLRPQIGSTLGKQVNVYLSEADRDVWERAQRYARDHGVSLSSLVAEALEHYLTMVAG